MVPTLLLDLDDTLLVNNIDNFLPRYLQLLSEELRGFAEPKELIDKLLAATRLMVKNKRPDCSLKAIFEMAFYPALQIDGQQAQPAIDRFYAEVFPSLRSLTRPNPRAIEMVQKAIERGYRLAVTTNPLFPRTAIYQRLSWAGLSPEDYPFELVTSYETFHFAKPDPAFFAEVLARLGWPEGPVVVVGDSLENDISAAHQMGLAAFWTPPEGNDLPAGSIAPRQIDSLLDWIEAQPPDSLSPDLTTPAAMLAVMRATPAALHTFCYELQPDDWTARPQPNEWSMVEILCHLRDVEQEVNLPRLRKILEEKNPFVVGMDTDPWALERNYFHQNGPNALLRFTAARLEALDLLTNLQPDEWQRTARHTIFGNTNLAELTKFNAGHDRLHIQQVINTLPR